MPISIKEINSKSKDKNNHIEMPSVVNVNYKHSQSPLPIHASKKYKPS